MPYPRESCSPPPILPQLTFHTEFSVERDVSPQPITAREEFDAGHNPSPRASLSPPPRLCSQSPQVRLAEPALRLRKTNKKQLLPKTTTSSHRLFIEDSGNPSRASSLAPSDDGVALGLIPKPAGEAGRPKRGGYNLEQALAWEPRDFTRLRTYVHRLMDEYLDIELPFTSQDEDAINHVAEKATEHFIALDSYEKCWPVRDIVRLRLKYTSSHSKEKSIKEKLTKSSLKRKKNRS